MLAPADKGGIGHHAAHQTLKMGRALRAFFLSCDLATTNPFDKFKLAAPDPRSVVWSPPARGDDCRRARRGNAEPGAGDDARLCHRPARGRLAGAHPRPVRRLARAQDAARGFRHPGAPGARRRAARHPREAAETRAWIEVPVVGEVREAVKANLARAKAAGLLTVLLDNTRTGATESATCSGEAGQTRFQRDFAGVREAAVAAAEKREELEFAAELATLQFRDLRRTCVVYLGELGMDAHLIAAVTGHDIDDTQRILKT